MCSRCYFYTLSRINGHFSIDIRIYTYRHIFLTYFYYNFLVLSLGLYCTCRYFRYNIYRWEIWYFLRNCKPNDEVGSEHEGSVSTNTISTDWKFKQWDKFRSTVSFVKMTVPLARKGPHISTAEVFKALRHRGFSDLDS